MVNLVSTRALFLDIQELTTNIAQIKTDIHFIKTAMEKWFFQKSL